MARTLAVFGSGALLLLTMTHVVIPIVSEVLGVELIISWFLVGGLGVVVPLLLLGVWLIRREQWSGEPPNLWVRLRLHPMTRTDWLWSAAALLTIAGMTAGVQLALRVVVEEVRLNPGFMTFLFGGSVIIHRSTFMYIATVSLSLSGISTIRKR